MSVMGFSSPRRRRLGTMSSDLHEPNRPGRPGAPRGEMGPYTCGVRSWASDMAGTEAEVDQLCGGYYRGIVDDIASLNRSLHIVDEPSAPAATKEAATAITPR